MEETTKAYLAGLLDADGYISIVKFKANNYHCLKIGISQGNEEFLIYWQQKVQLGGIYRDKQKKRADGYVRQDMFSWQIHGLEAATLLEGIYSFLILKKEQARIALEFSQTINHQRHKITPASYKIREECRRQILLLNNNCREDIT